MKLKGFHLSEKDFADIVTGKVVVKNEFPKDMKFNRFYHDAQRCCYFVAFESSEFEDVPEGNEIPIDYLLVEEGNA